MRESANAYVPRDRLHSLVSGEELPPRPQGSVLFADISGFTPLTEAYEVHLGSRKGGEELTRILNEVYADLIGEVERLRGSVIGFAGDAITCWFDGDDGLRSVNAALAMQKGMSRFSAVPSPDGGKISLGLKAAVSSGKVRRFVVGEPDIQRVDVLAGDPVYRVAEVEQAAERGEVLVDAETRAALGQRVCLSGERKDKNGKAVAWVVKSIEEDSETQPWGPIEEISLPREAVDPWMIHAIRDRLRSGLGDFFTELRPATTLFMKFDGIDYEEDAQADRKLDAFFSRVQSIVSDLGGVVHQLTLGDKGSFLYAAFGAPISHEDDTRRTLLAALHLRDLPKDLSFVSNVQIGIGRGTTRTGAYGGPTRRTYGVLGDQVNLAARLMGKAANGQILVSDSAAKEGLKAFRLEALPPIMVKGKAQPISVHSLEAVLEESSAEASPTDYAIPMVGRKDELARILALLDEARAGRGQSISVVADAGMGKSRLVGEVIHRARDSGFRILQGECQTFGTNTLYTPWWSIWRRFFGLKAGATVEDTQESLGRFLEAVDPSLVPRLPLLGPVLNMPLPDNELTRTFDSKLRRASLESLLVECLRAESARQPFLIVIEDAHAIDPVSRDLLRMFTQAQARLAMAFLIVRRPVGDDAILGPAERSLEYVHRLDLKEFTTAESDEWIRRKFRQLFGGDIEVPVEVVRHIAERTGGNPFFIEEVMNWMAQQDIEIQSAEALDAADLPVSLYSLVLSRMDQLDENSRIAMKVASVIGRLFRAAVVWGIYPELGGETAVKEALERIRSRRFTTRAEEETDLAYEFMHVVIHEVAYESLTHELRLRMHESIARFIELNFPPNTPQVLDLLAFHFGRSSNTEKQREYYLKAGDAARRAYANSAAAGYYKAVLPLLGKRERIPVLRHLGEVLEFAGEWKTAMERYKEALALSQEEQLPGEASYFRLYAGDLLRKTGTFEEASAWLNEARKAFQELGDEGGYGQALHSAGTLAAQTGNYGEARHLYTQSMEIRRKTGDESKVASLLSNTGIILRFQNELEKALELQEESLAIRRRLNDPWAIGNSLNNLGMAKRYRGDLAGARRDLEEALGILKKVGDRAEIANTLNSLAEVALDQQDTGACEAYLKESLQLTRELGNLRALAFLFEAFASNAFFQKNPWRCLRLFGAAKALRESIGAPLPDNDTARIEETIDLASQSMRNGNPHEILQEGAALPLSTALAFAAAESSPD